MKHLFLLLCASTALADSIKIQGMSCHGCEKQIRAVVCQDPEIRTWMNTCDAKVIDPKAAIGELRYYLRTGVVLDKEKMDKIEAAVVSTGRSVIH